MTEKKCVDCKYWSIPATQDPCRACARRLPPTFLLGGETDRWEPAEDGATICHIDPPDPVNPQHYKRFPIEVIQIVRHLPFNLGCAVKYCCRAGHKDDQVQDLRKAIWYLEDEIQRLTGEGEHAKP